MSNKPGEHGKKTKYIHINSQYAMTHDGREWTLYTIVRNEKGKVTSYRHRGYYYKLEHVADMLTNSLDSSEMTSIDELMESYKELAKQIKKLVKKLGQTG